MSGRRKSVVYILCECFRGDGIGMIDGDVKLVLISKGRESRLSFNDQPERAGTDQLRCKIVQLSWMWSHTCLTPGTMCRIKLR